MRILFQTRPDLFELKAGDTVQMINTKKHLEKLGVNVFFSSDYEKDLSDFDVIHIFNTHHIDHSYACFQNAKNQNKKVVLTPIIIDLDEYNKKGRYGIESFVYKFGHDIDFVEFLKYQYLSVKDSKFKKLFNQYKNLKYSEKKKQLIEQVDGLIALSELEKKFLQVKYSINSPIEIICNAVEPNFNSSSFNNNPKRDSILCVGKIEPLKNQINLIKAYRKSKLSEKLIFVGQPNLKHKAFFRKFLSMISRDPMLTYMGYFNNEDISIFYKMAKVHVLPSWFENAPLVNLEAVLCGCNIVMSDRGFGSEYLGETVNYCDPSNIDSISDAIIKANQRKFDEGLRRKVVSKYNWFNVSTNLKRFYGRINSCS